MINRIFFSTSVRADVWRFLADLCDTGLELGRALEIVAQIYSRRSPPVSKIVLDLRESLRSDRFPERVRKYAPGAESLIFARFGKVPDAELFKSAARIVTAQNEIRNTIMKGVIKPAFIFVLLVVLLFFLGADFYPTLMIVSPRESWPGSWQFVASLALWVAENPLLLTGYFVAIYVIYKLILRYYTGAFRTQLDRLPPFSLHRLSLGATFTFILIENAAVGNAINSRLLADLRKGSSPYLQSRIRAIERNLASMNIGSAMVKAGQEFPDMEINAVLEAYAERKDWVPRFRRFADAWLARLETRVQAAIAVINMALLILAAGLIAVIGRTIFGVINIVQ